MPQDDKLRLNLGLDFRFTPSGYHFSQLRTSLMILVVFSECYVAFSIVNTNLRKVLRFGLFAFTDLQEAYEALLAEKAEDSYLQSLDPNRLNRFVICDARWDHSTQRLAIWLRTHTIAYIDLAQTQSRVREKYEFKTFSTNNLG